ncbi:hypothetical protein OS493_023689 [Desmophyllum pertusum]|uniref:Uncharacterized protein n=1 Tax=Desmophyllum pertusum TaxID=174260 RepID=A0A9X0CQH1_9CNID|nr:hypothetical protein OS493_023689 [Desmophyllum pertusum]
MVNEHRFAIKTEWNGAQINHAPITFQISAQDSRVVRISVSGPFFDDPGPPPCAVGSACDGLWITRARTASASHVKWSQKAILSKYDFTSRTFSKVLKRCVLITRGKNTKL